MSNSSLKNRIAEAVEKFEAGTISLPAFRSTLLSNGSALEAMPYSLIKELDHLEYLLTISQFYEEEGCECSPSEAIATVKGWLHRVPE